MKILFLHGWQSVPGGVKPTYLAQHGHEVVKPGSESVFDVHIGTPGLPTRNSQYPVFAPLTTSEVPAMMHPVAHFEFPNKVAGQAPTKLEVTLDQRC